MAMWSVVQAAQSLGISPQRVRQLLSTGRIEGQKISGTWIVLKLEYKRKKKPTRRDDLYVRGEED